MWQLPVFSTGSLEDAEREMWSELVLCSLICSTETGEWSFQMSTRSMLYSVNGCLICFSMAPPRRGVFSQIGITLRLDRRSWFIRRVRNCWRNTSSASLGCFKDVSGLLGEWSDERIILIIQVCVIFHKTIVNIWERDNSDPRGANWVRLCM